MNYLIEREKRWITDGRYWLEVSYRVKDGKVNGVPFWQLAVILEMKKLWTRICLYEYDETKPYGEGRFIAAWININKIGMCRCDNVPQRQQAQPYRKS